MVGNQQGEKNSIFPFMAALEIAQVTKPWIFTLPLQIKAKTFFPQPLTPPPLSPPGSRVIRLARISCTQRFKNPAIEQNRECGF